MVEFTGSEGTGGAAALERKGASQGAEGGAFPGPPPRQGACSPVRFGHSCSGRRVGLAPCQGPGASRAGGSSGRCRRRCEMAPFVLLLTEVASSSGRCRTTIEWG